jgi:hypothetical protein
MFLKVSSHLTGTIMYTFVDMSSCSGYNPEGSGHGPGTLFKPVSTASSKYRLMTREDQSVAVNMQSKYDIIFFHRFYFSGKMLAYLRYKEIPHNAIYGSRKPFPLGGFAVQREASRITLMACSGPDWEAGQ